MEATEEWIKRRCGTYIQYIWYIYITEYYSAIKKNQIVPFAATWVDLEIALQTEVRQTEKYKYHMISHVWNLKKNDINEFIQKIEIES